MMLQAWDIVAPIFLPIYTIEAGIEAFIILGIFVFGLLWEIKLKNSPLIDGTRLVSKAPTAFDKTSCKFAVSRGLAKLEIPKARGRSLWEAVQGLERYRNTVWEQGVDLTDRFSKRGAGAFYINLMSCVVQGGASTLPVLPRNASDGSAQGAAGWIQQLLSDMRKFDFERDAELYLNMMKLFASQELWEEVLLFHKEMETDNVEPNGSLLVGFMTAAVGQKDFTAALDHFHTLARLEPPSQRTYMTVLKVYEKQSDWEGAFRLSEEMQKFGTAPDPCVLNNILRLCVNAGQMGAAEKVLDRWAISMDVISCNTVIKGLARLGGPDALRPAEAMLSRMLSCGPAPNLVTFNSVIECCFRVLQALEPSVKEASKLNAVNAAKRKDDAAIFNAVARRPWELYDKLVEVGLEPDRYTLSPISKCMHLAGASSKQVGRFISLVKQLGPTAFQITNNNHANISKRMVFTLFNALLDVCVSCEDLDRMIELFELMQQFDVGICAVTYCTLVKAFGRAGQISRCHKFWQQMLDASIKPTIVTYGCYIDACVRNNELSRAERIFSSMNESDAKPNIVIYTCLIRGLAQSGQPVRAFALYRHMRAAGVEPTSNGFNTVLDMIARQLAEPESFQDMIGDLQSVEDSPDVVALSNVIKACCDTGSLDNAVALWRQLRLHGITPEEVAFSNILRTCAKADRVSDAEEIFSNMIQTGKWFTNAETSTLVKMYGRVKLTNKAIEIVDTVEKAGGQKPDLGVYTCVIQACQASKVWKRADEIYQKMLLQGIKPDEKLSSMMKRR